MPMTLMANMSDVIGNDECAVCRRDTDTLQYYHCLETHVVICIDCVLESK